MAYANGEVPAGALILVLENSIRQIETPPYGCFCPTRADFCISRRPELVVENPLEGGYER